MNSAVWEGGMLLLGQWELLWHRDVLLRLTAAAQLSNVSCLTSRGTWFSWKWSRGNVKVRQMYSDDVSFCTKELQDFHDREYKYFFSLRWNVAFLVVVYKVIVCFLQGFFYINSQFKVIKSELCVCRIVR